jgi:hypothetical protein
MARCLKDTSAGIDADGSDSEMVVDYQIQLEIHESLENHRFHSDDKCFQGVKKEGIRDGRQPLTENIVCLWARRAFNVAYVAIDT